MRELRGGLSGFYVFIACIALGVMAIAGVGSVSASLVEGLAREGRVILGGDVSFNLIMREADTNERAFMSGRGALSTIATMRSMARTDDGRNALVEMKAVDAAYPLFGTVSLVPAQPLPAALAARDGIFGAVADPALLARLDLKPPARITIGSATIRNPRHASVRARQACRRHRLRATPSCHQRCTAGDRAAAAGRPGALALSPAACR